MQLNVAGGAFCKENVLLLNSQAATQLFCKETPCQRIVNHYVFQYIMARSQRSTAHIHLGNPYDFEGKLSAVVL